ERRADACPVLEKRSHRSRQLRSRKTELLGHLPELARQSRCPEHYRRHRHRNRIDLRAQRQAVDGAPRDYGPGRRHRRLPKRPDRRLLVHRHPQHTSPTTLQWPRPLSPGSLSLTVTRTVPTRLNKTPYSTERRGGDSNCLEGDDADDVEDAE